jgi:hypothetical protein
MNQNDINEHFEYLYLLILFMSQAIWIILTLLNILYA